MSNSIQILPELMRETQQFKLKFSRYCSGVTAQSERKLIFPYVFLSVRTDEWTVCNKHTWDGRTLDFMFFYVRIRGGGTDLERGYGDVRPWRPPFHVSPAARKGPISSKRVSSQDPLLRKFGNFSLNSLNFHPNFSSQAPKFGNFPLTSPPFQRQMSVRKPHTSEIRAVHPYLKKSWVGPRG